MIRQNFALSRLGERTARPVVQAGLESVDALRDYNEGLQLIRQGKNLEAMKKLQVATSEIAVCLAFSRLGEAHCFMGYDTEAEQSARRAVDLSQQLPGA